jgi:hypothetical protein
MLISSVSMHAPYTALTLLNFCSSMIFSAGERRAGENPECYLDQRCRHRRNTQYTGVPWIITLKHAPQCQQRLLFHPYFDREVFSIKAISVSLASPAANKLIEILA